jgi:hypothetical protein
MKEKMRMMQTLNEIIKDLSVEYVTSVTVCDNVSALLAMKRDTCDVAKLALIEARIDRINYLVI